MTKRQLVRRFGEKVRTLRIHHGMTMQGLADKLDTSSGYISLVENGQRKPGADFIFRIAQLFGVSTDVLLNDELDLPEC
jgi:transcriptional regulator with XRE-family HTH domain